MVRQTVLRADWIIAFFNCTTSQSLSVVPCFRSMALMPKKHKSALICLILAMASAPMVIFEFFEMRSPIIITSMVGCCMYSSIAGILPDMNVAFNWRGNERAISMMVVPPLVSTNMSFWIRAAALWAMIFLWSNE